MSVTLDFNPEVLNLKVPLGKTLTVTFFIKVTDPQWLIDNPDATAAEIKAAPKIAVDLTGLTFRAAYYNESKEKVFTMLGTWLSPVPNPTTGAVDVTFNLSDATANYWELCSDSGSGVWYPWAKGKVTPSGPGESP